MQSDVITPARFHAILNAIPKNADGDGLKRDAVYYSYAREKSGVYKGQPYTKPAHIQINAQDKRFWVEWVDQALRLTYDPAGKFNPISIDQAVTLRELEGHFRALEGHLQIIAHQQQASAPAKPGLARDDLKRFIQHVLPWGDAVQRAQVEQAIMLACQSPRQYIQAHAAQLARRGIHAPAPHLHVIALVDTLQALGAAAEVDWKADHETVLWHVSRIAHHLGIFLEPVADAPALSTLESLQKISQDLSARHHVLITVDIDADAYVLLIVPAPSYPKVRALADKIGVKVGRFRATQ
jgi:hypothetical protein